MLRFFRERSTPGIEAVDDRCYRRTIQIGDAKGVIEATSDRNASSVILRVRLSRLDSLIHVAQRVRRLFDLGADPSKMSKVPGAWDALETVVLAILGQRSAGAPSATAVRLMSTFGEPIETSIPGLTHLFPLSEVLAKADLASIGIRPAKADAIRALAAGLRDDEIAPRPSKGRLSMVARILVASGLSELTSLHIARRALGEP